MTHLKSELLSGVRHPTTIYPNVIVGKNFQTGHYVLIRENTVIGDDARIGSYGELDGDIQIGNNFSCHSRCHLSKYMRIGNNVRLMFNVTTLNDQYPPMGHYAAPILGNDIIIASNVVLLPTTIVEDDSFVPANTIVKGVWKSNGHIYRRLLRGKGYNLQQPS